MIEALSSALQLVLLALMGVSLLLWARLLWRRRDQIGVNLLDSLLPPRPRHRPFWTPADVLLMLGAMVMISQAILVVLIRKGFIQRAAAGEASPELTAPSLVWSIVATSAGGLAAVAITVAWLRIFTPDARRRVGLTVSLDDLKLGLKGALMILPPVLLISGAVTYLVPYEHPVLESLAKIATPSVFLATFVGTALVTPLVEEFLVRGMLQGSLQGIADRESEDEPPWYAQPYAPERIAGSPTWQPRAYWPLVVASAVFAGLHIGGQGAAPIPLFFLSLGLGFLYRQTGSLLPSILVHVILNGLTLVVEFLKLMSP